MTRNLENRVEVVAPVEEEVHREECRTILNACLNDPISAWDMQPDGSYIKRNGTAEEGMCAQDKMIALAEERSKSARAHKKVNWTLVECIRNSVSTAKTAGVGNYLAHKHSIMPFPP